MYSAITPLPFTAGGRLPLQVTQNVRLFIKSKKLHHMTITWTLLDIPR